MFGEGISREGDILDLAANLGIVNKSGAWYAYNEGKIGQGRENAKKYLKDNPQVAEEIEGKVREHYRLGEGSETAKAGEASKTSTNSENMEQETLSLENPGEE